MNEKVKPKKRQDSSLPARTLWLRAPTRRWAAKSRRRLDKLKGFSRSNYHSKTRRSDVDTAYRFVVAFGRRGMLLRMWKVGLWRRCRHRPRDRPFDFADCISFGRLALTVLASAGLAGSTTAFQSRSSRSRELRCRWPY